ncbi:MAG: CPBP family intramembrane metalloprotease [Actinomycetaceae bacterium]|nr:CPBP family intramembrane metalloprotease [Actinomycetaceae bacterium]
MIFGGANNSDGRGGRWLPMAAGIAALVFMGDALVSNLLLYFSDHGIERYLNFSLSAGLFPLGTVRGLVYVSVIGMIMLVGAVVFNHIRGCRRLSARDRWLAVAVGFFGAAAWMNSSGFLALGFSPLITVTGIDTFLGGTHRAEQFSSLPSDANPLLEAPSVALAGAVEECAYAVLLTLLVRYRRWRLPYAITIVVVLRGLVHLHTGTVYELLSLLPVGLFAAFYVLETGRIVPLMLGHAAFNYLALTPPSPMSYGTWQYILGVGAIPVMTTLGYALTLIGAMALSGREKAKEVSYSRL